MGLKQQLSNKWHLISKKIANISNATLKLRHRMLDFQKLQSC